jgi:HSP20 family protein
MAVRDIIPWRRKEGADLATRDFFGDTFARLQREMNALFDSFFTETGLERVTTSGFPFTPNVDVVETDDAVKVSAELPGLDEKDLEVSIDDHGLVLKGEKKSEVEETKAGVHRLERSYGSFFRRIALPAEVDYDKAEANFTKGVLTIELPKTKSSKSKTVKINVK